MNQFDPKAVVSIYAGNLLTGYADGTFVSAKRTSDKQTAVVGSDGQVCVVKSADNSGEITLTLMASSKSNDILSAIATLQEIGPLVPAPFLLKDLLGTTVVSGQNAWIKKRPDIEFGKELSNREWVFGVENLIMLAGGNF